VQHGHGVGQSPVGSNQAVGTIGVCLGLFGLRLDVVLMLLPTHVTTLELRARAELR
jgi:hypothetical protein